MASPSARKMRRTGIRIAATPASSRSMSSIALKLKRFCGCTCRIRERASEGGRKAGST
jgi:translation initiation factor 1 (eIF-1/SUI1)